jgi:hypothetical protein
MESRLQAVPHLFSSTDKQGKRSIETPTSRGKENPPAKTGSQRVQDQTKSRTAAAVGKTGSARQQEKTRAEASKAQKK